MTHCFFQLAVASVLSYDVYKRYLHPKALGRQVIVHTYLSYYLVCVFSSYLPINPSGEAPRLSGPGLLDWPRGALARTGGRPQNSINYSCRVPLSRHWPNISRSLFVSVAMSYPGPVHSQLACSPGLHNHAQRPCGSRSVPCPMSAGPQ